MKSTLIFVVIFVCPILAASIPTLRRQDARIPKMAWHKSDPLHPIAARHLPNPPPTPPSPPAASPKARITMLDIGHIKSTNNGNGKNFEYIPTIALIEDGKDNKIVFDTGLPTDSGSLNRMLEALKRLRIPPTAINKVILSHAHLDHVGHSSVFTKAKIYHANHMFDGFSLTYIGTYEFGGYNVTENVRIVPTPGHTPTCISALVTNAETQKTKTSFHSLGTVAITGDLFFKVEDLTDSSIWKSSSTDIPTQEKSRKAILCKSDYIIPGHGPMFKVPTAQKQGCK